MQMAWSVSEAMEIGIVVGVIVVLLVLRSVLAAAESAYTSYEWVPNQRWEEGLASKLVESKGPAAYTFGFLQIVCTILIVVVSIVLLIGLLVSGTLLYILGVGVVIAALTFLAALVRDLLRGPRE